MPDAVIVATARSPIGRAGKGSLAGLRPDDLLVQVLISLFAARPEVNASELDDLIVGCGLPGGEAGFNIGRAAAVLLGEDRLPGLTVNRYCASSLQSIRMAAHAIRAREGDAFVAAGVESVSRTVPGVPDGIEHANAAFAELPPAPHPWRDPRARGLLPNLHISMGQTAEHVAALYGITRTEADDFAYHSQRKAEAARQRGFWAAETSTVQLPDGRMWNLDDSPRPTTTREGLAALTPAFVEGGIVTAGNSCPLNDGAAAVMVMSDDRARDLGLRPLTRIVSTAVSALSPEMMGLGPVEASRRALARAGLTVADLDQVEINEAFAAQVIACQRDLGIPDEKLNVNGGGIALGHPYGMTGARVATTLTHSLVDRDQQFGLETMCVAGGMGMAMIIERVS